MLRLDGQRLQIVATGLVIVAGLAVSVTEQIQHIGVVGIFFVEPGELIDGDIVVAVIYRLFCQGVFGLCDLVVVITAGGNRLPGSGKRQNQQRCCQTRLATRT